MTDSKEIVTNFDKMGLKEDLLRALYSYGFEKPSDIQQRSIMPMLTGKDIIAQAPSGTGKTGAFVIGTLNQLDYTKPCVQAIFISPTRELADQTWKVANALGTYNDGKGNIINLKTIKAIGGSEPGCSVKENLEQIKDGGQILIGTPGRVLDILTRMPVIIKNIKILVLDEADEMLNRGFKDTLYSILTEDAKSGKPALPDEMQVALFSATLPDEALAIASKFMNKPTVLTIKKSEVALDGIKQYYIPIEKEAYKIDTLLDILSSLPITKCVVFCNTKQKAEWLCENLSKNEISTKIIHSELPQATRNSVMDSFRGSSVNLLIATDLIGRGIDVKGISHVINYDLPHTPESYIHRIGRSGRYGSKGMSISFTTPNDGKFIDEVQAHSKQPILAMPSIEDLLKE